MPDYDVVIVGGGAAGFFSALRIKELQSDCKILILEKTGKLLSKVKISGGGRCNVTNACFDIKILSANYPRGQKELYPCFFRFNPKDTVQWFEKRGIAIHAESDGRMFPETNDSQTIIDCFLQEAYDSDIKIKMHTALESINQTSEGIELRLSNLTTIHAKTVLIASGGHHKAYQFDYLNNTEHTIINPVPSLFTFNLPNEKITELKGVSVNQARVSLPQFKMKFDGSVLITHWGLSGPAVLKLSAFAALKLQEVDYEYEVVVNWLPTFAHETVLETLIQLKSGKKKLLSKPFAEIPQRLWEYFLSDAGLSKEALFVETSHKDLRILANLLTEHHFSANGKTTYKEEFVTAGGVCRKEIDFRTMESKLIKGLYFAGEVIDIDGITGGFNFQAAWTTGWIAAESICHTLAAKNLA